MILQKNFLEEYLEMNNTNVYHVSSNNFPESLVNVLAMILDKISRCSADGRTLGEDKICLSGDWSVKSLDNLRLFLKEQVIGHIRSDDERFVTVSYDVSSTSLEMPREESGTGAMRESINIFMVTFTIRWTAG